MIGDRRDNIIGWTLALHVVNWVQSSVLHIVPEDHQEYQTLISQPGVINKQL